MIPYNPDLAETNKFPVTVEGENDPTWVTYEQFVTNLVKERGEASKNLEHMAMKAASEAGELIDGIYRHTGYGEALDRANIIEELGDLEFYMAGLRQMLGMTRYETLAANIAKLQKRYKNGYSDQAAIDRADKNPVIVDATGHVIQGEQLHIIDMADQSGKKDTVDPAPAALPPASTTTPEPDAPTPVLQDWVVPLIVAYHANKEVAAISYTKNTATVLFVGENNPHKLYRPKGEI